LAEIPDKSSTLDRLDNSGISNVMATYTVRAGAHVRKWVAMDY
jgi:hypothetical protein